MALQTFDFPYHTFETENPDSSTRLQLGGSYIFSAPPSDPDQRTFTLHFPVMKYFVNEDTGLVDPSVNPTLNFRKLSLFYQDHKTHKSFLYNHPVYGILEVKFKTPLKEPEGIPGGNGALKEFEIQLIEIP